VKVLWTWRFILFRYVWLVDGHTTPLLSVASGRSSRNQTESGSALHMSFSPSVRKRASLFDQQTLVIATACRPGSTLNVDLREERRDHSSS